MKQKSLIDSIDIIKYPENLKWLISLSISQYFFCLHDPSWRHACHAASGTGTARPSGSWRIPGRWPWRWCFLPWVWLAKKRPKLRRFDENIGKHLLGPLKSLDLSTYDIWMHMNCQDFLVTHITIVTQLHSKHLQTIWLILCSKTLKLWREIGSISSQPLQSPGVQWVPGAAGRSSCGSFWAQAVIRKSLCSIRFFSWYYSVNLGIFNLENYWDEVDSFNSLCIFLYISPDGVHITSLLNLLQGFCKLMNYHVRLCTWGAWSLKQLKKTEIATGHVNRTGTEKLSKPPKKVKALPQYNYWTTLTTGWSWGLQTSFNARWSLGATMNYKLESTLEYVVHIRSATAGYVIPQAIHRVSIWTASSQYQWQMKDNRDPIQKWKPSGRHCYCKGGHAKISIWSLPLADLCTFIFPTKSLATWDVSWCIIGSISYTMASNKYNFSPASTKRELGRLAALIKWKDGRLSHVFLQTIPLNSLLLALKKSKRKTKNAVGEGGRKKGKQVCEGLVQEPSAQETGFSGGMGAPERDMHI